MGQNPPARRQASLTRTAALALSATFILFSGCQSFAPTGLGSLTAKQREQKIVKQAANDPFPSPSDVGLASNKETKTL